MRQEGSFAKNGITCDRLSARRAITSPLRLTACTWKTFLARSRPTVVISIVVAPSSCCVTAPLWRCDAESGSHPPHLVLSAASSTANGEDGREVAGPAGSGRKHNVCVRTGWRQADADLGTSLGKSDAM